jgi:hypothetical protein
MTHVAFLDFFEKTDNLVFTELTFLHQENFLSRAFCLETSTFEL